MTEDATLPTLLTALLPVIPFNALPDCAVALTHININNAVSMIDNFVFILIKKNNLGAKLQIKADFPSIYNTFFKISIIINLTTPNYSLFRDIFFTQNVSLRMVIITPYTTKMKQ